MISWNEIKQRAIAFSYEWAQEGSEEAEAKSFWDGFFHIFGVSRRRVATFEQSVKRLDEKQGFIDLLWKGVILVEHKSRGRSLDKAFDQAKSYFSGLKEYELPRYILVSDFARFRLYDLDAGSAVEFLLAELVQNVELFGFIAGYEKRVYREEDRVNIEAAEHMGKLHDRLQEIGYTGHDLELYLVRLLFCLFADDTTIFEKGSFWEYIDLRTKADGSDLAMHLDSIFQTLNTPPERRLKTLDQQLAQFPYVNGRLFAERLALAAFDTKMREMLLEACALDWSGISPAIFGSLFQAATDPQKRRHLGAHYTSEKNILKAIGPLFLDDLHDELLRAKGNKTKLRQLHDKIAQLRFLDPACGCGNFLIIAYRALRELELQILRELYQGENQLALDVQHKMIRVDVDQFYGIEYDEFPSRVAQVAMWLVDHQLNLQVSQQFGQYFVRLPLKKEAKIVHGNALTIDWTTVVSAEQLHYIMGNPPFVGKSLQSAEQKREMTAVFNDVQGAGVLDYVAAWYLKAAQMTQHNPSIRCAFVSTNSIAQGEQVGVLWQELYQHYQQKIHFAHRTFRWWNEAKGNAAVHCVIIGFGREDLPNKRVFDYVTLNGEPIERKVRNINPYLTEGNDTVVVKRTKPLCPVPEIVFGSMPNDGGFLLLSKEEKESLLQHHPSAKKYIRPMMGSKEFINNRERYCLWLQDVDPSELKQYPAIIERVKKVQQVRLQSSRAQTKNLAQFPTLFGEIRQPKTAYLAIPEVSSQRRKYIPIGYLSSNVIASNKIQMIADASYFLFGLLTSEMHMAWVRVVCGRLKSDFDYSSSVIYNNFPFPANVSEANQKRVEKAAQAVLDARANFPHSSLADLYDPLTMPPILVKAHQTLDKAVDLCYRPQPFPTDFSRIEFLFQQYEALTAPLLSATKKSRKPKK